MKPTANKSLTKYDWQVPSSLKEFYSIHDGFGELEGGCYVMSSAEIKVKAEMMDPFCAEQNYFPEGYEFRDLLEFYPDGAGNAQCFYRSNGENNITVDWDHEIWRIAGEYGFFEFIDERMSDIDYY